MTYTLHKRMHRASSPPHAHAADGRMPRFSSSTPSDPAALAEALRVLAIRAHHALKIAQNRIDESIRVELRDLRASIRWLEGEFRSQQLDRMLPYVVSLRIQVESAL